MDEITVTPKWITFPAISIEARSDHDSDSPEREMGFFLGSSLNWDHEDNTLNANVILKNSEEEDPAEYNREYNFSIHAYGVFEVSDDYLKLSEKTSKKILIDISSAMIGSIREQLTALTSRSPWGSYTLPFLDTEELADNLYKSALKKMQKKRSKKA